MDKQEKLEKEIEEGKAATEEEEKKADKKAVTEAKAGKVGESILKKIKPKKDHKTGW